MIILDPDLESDRSTKMVKRSAAPTERANPRDNRVPSAPTLARFLREAEEAVRLRGQVTVLLTTDRAMRRLNRQFRGKNKATDVLSFPAYSPVRKGEKPAAPRDLEIAGDIAISVDTARKQAAVLGHALAVEIKVLMLHGLLHLAGYDHETDDGEMARREEKLRESLRLPHGLIERAGAAGARGLSSPIQSPIKLGNEWGTQSAYKAGKERRA